jgi:hypothetical protein
MPPHNPHLMHAERRRRQRLRGIWLVPGLTAGVSIISRLAAIACLRIAGASVFI